MTMIEKKRRPAERIAPSPRQAAMLVGDILATLREIRTDYDRAHEEAYRAADRGQGAGGDIAYSDPTGETAMARESMRHACVRTARKLWDMRAEAERLAADLDAMLRQSDDPKAQANRAEMAASAEAARALTKQERQALQDERDRAFNADLRKERAS